MSEISSNQNREFSSEIANPDALKEAIEWIKSNLGPEDVFDLMQLVEWAENNHYFLSALEKGG